MGMQERARGALYYKAGYNQNITVPTSRRFPYDDHDGSRRCPQTSTSAEVFSPFAPRYSSPFGLDHGFLSGPSSFLLDHDFVLSVWFFSSRSRFRMSHMRFWVDSSCCLACSRCFCVKRYVGNLVWIHITNSGFAFLSSISEKRAGPFFSAS